MEKSKYIIYLFFILLFGYQCYDFGRNSIKIEEPIETIKIDTVERVDTVRDTICHLIREKAIESKYDTILKVVNDTDTIQVPIEHKIIQKEYSDGNTYTAWISGCYPNLDSIKVYERHTTINREIEKIKKDNRKFGIGLQVGSGYDPINKQFNPYVGIGIQYNLIKF